jgi:anaerobic magnesium-protoporphyrin IX monomethyl ester cyclase
MIETKKKILLLNPPFSETIIRDNYCCFTSKTGYLWTPTDLLYVSALLNMSLFEVKAIDAVAEKKSWDKVSAHFLNNKYDAVVCLTGTASFNGDMSQMEYLKEKHGFKLYVMGNTPAFMPRQFLEEFPYVDAIFHNFFDEEIPLAILGKPFKGLCISYKKDGEIHVGSVNGLQKVDLPNPPQHSLFPLNSYGTMFSKLKPMTTSILTYGCPFRCVFCIGGAINYKPRSIENIQMEFEAMKKTGIKEIFFQDSTFNSDLGRFNQVLDLLGKYAFSWSAHMHSFQLSDEVLQKMKKTGCHTIQIGVESGDKDILDKYAPSKKLQSIESVFDRCKKIGIRTLGYFIIGFPDDTEKTVMETINFAKKINPDFASFSIMTPDYGTELYKKITGEEKIQSLKSFDSSGGATIKNSSLSQKDQDRLLLKAYVSFYLRPVKILSYFKKPDYVWLYSKHAFRLFYKRIGQIIKR